MDQSEIFSIRQLIELTGLSEFTIRGWENRYAAFKPQRSDTGRREYSKNDVERALLIRELLKRGCKIGKIAQHSNRQLLELFEQTEQNRKNNDNTKVSRSATRALELMALQKWTELSDYFKKKQKMTAPELIRSFLLPLISGLATQVQAGVVSIAQEHILSSFLKEKIYSALSELENKKKSSLRSSHLRFVLAAPEGDYHEIGLLMAHLLIRSFGFTSLYLGPNTPPQDLAETALRFEASHMLIVSTVSKKQGARQELLSFVSDVQNKVGSSLQILIAGYQVPHISNDPKNSLTSLASFDDFEVFLQSLRGKPI